MRIQPQIKQIIFDLNVTVYGAAQMVGADYPDTDIKTIHRRLTTWTDPSLEPKYFGDLEGYLDALGYEIAIVKKGSKRISRNK